MLLGFPAYSHHHHRGQAEEVPKPVLGESIYNLNSSWKNQENQEMKLSAFRSQPVIMAMIYTSCRDVCPLTILDMQRIEKGLSEKARDKARFVVVSFDPEKDSPQKLAEYGKAHGLDFKKWTLLNGSAEAVRELAAILDVRYKKLKTSDFEHSNIITILDREGVIKYQQVGLSQDPKKSIDTVESQLH